MEQTYMKERKILPLVLSMSMPMVLSMAVNSLYNIVDSYFVAQMSEEAMTALALVYPIQNMVNAVAVGFAIGINACVAFWLGAKEKALANQSATQGMLFSLIHGIGMSILCIALAPAFLSMFSSDSETIELALTYSNRAFLFCPVITIGIGYEKIFQAVGKMKVSMFSIMCGFIVNIVLDPLMIFGIGFFPEMGIAGAAYATGIGQCVTLIVYLLFYHFDKIPVKIKKEYLRPNANVIQKMYSVGISASLNLALPSLLISVLNAILASFGAVYVLVLGVYYKLQTFIYLTANGIVQGIRPLMGYNYGAKEYGRVKSIFKTSLFLIAIVMVIGTILSWTIPTNLIGLFTENTETIKIGAKALQIISLGFIVSAVSVTCCGALEGLGKGLPSLCISLLRYIVIIIPLAFLLSRFLQADGVWYAFCITEAITAVVSLIIYKKSAKTSTLDKEGARRMPLI